MDAALEVFGERGFDGATVNEIAKKAEVSNGLMYNYFVSKEDLVITLFKDFLANHYEVWSKRTKEAKSPFEKLTIAVDRYIIPLKEDPNKWSLIRELSSRAEFKEEFWQSVNPIRDFYKEALRPIYESLGLNAETEFWALQTYLEGISLCYHSYGHRYPLDEMRETYLSRFQYLIDKPKK